MKDAVQIYDGAPTLQKLAIYSEEELLFSYVISFNCSSPVRKRLQFIKMLR